MPEFAVRNVDALPYVYAEGRASMRPEDIKAAVGAAFGQVMAAMQAAGVEPTGPALAVYDSYDPDRMEFR